ncbi:outer membrane lipoprotein carrier protein LolA [Colwellia sp. 39_35_sub15_T18]|nr:outer membrane lipoprotein carrier protein LolA [Colwellia sp. 39_35_sub15_T18]
MNKKTLANAFMALALSTSSSHLFAQANNLSATELVQATQPSQVTKNTTNSASKKLLMAKLSHLDFFTANFNQQVLSESGEVIEESTGKLAISKPNLANWQVLTPDELSIVSDGSSVWFYNPWIEQVSVYALSAAIARTPILLLTSKDETLWQQYRVEEINKLEQKSTSKADDQKSSQQTFVISAIDTNSQIKSLTLVFEAKKAGGEGQLSEFSFLDATGQLSRIRLSEFNDQQAPTPALFHFEVPQDTQIDDQR